MRSLKEKSEARLKGKDPRTKIRIVLVGSGPRGTCLFGALVRKLKQELESVTVEIIWIDPCINVGCEVYDRLQPAYLIMKTIAEQLTAYPDELDGTQGLEKCTMAGWMRDTIDPLFVANTYASRRAHGEYLLHVKCLSYFEKRTASQDIEGDLYSKEHFDKMPAAFRIDWETLKLHCSHIKAASQQESDVNLRAFLEKDFKEAQMGNIQSCFKAASDSLRDLRDGTRYAVEWCGLLPETEVEFANDFVPVCMRSAVGVPLIRVEQMMALWDAGILHMNLGPDPIVMPVGDKGYEVRSQSPGAETYSLNLLVKARISSQSGGRMARAQLESGLRRLVQAEAQSRISAIDIDVFNVAIEPSGAPVLGLSIFGELAEGINWYTYTAARPHVDSRVLCDGENWSHRAVARLLHEPSRLRSENNQLNLGSQRAA